MRGEWITFEELCARVPEKSARTLNRMVKDRQLSCRQRVRGGKREFNWLTVQQELATTERTSRVRIQEAPPSNQILSVFADQIAKLTQQVETLTSEVRQQRRSA